MRSLGSLLTTSIVALVAVGTADAQLALQLGQSSSRTISSTGVSVTTLNGVPGFFSSTVTRPFVTGFVPVVGEYPQPFDAAGYLAQQDQQRLARIRESRKYQKNKALQKYLSRAEWAGREGNLRMARANYRRALAIAAEPLRAELQRRLRELMRD